MADRAGVEFGHQQGVAVAVRAYGGDPQRMARGLTFFPEALAAAAEEDDPAPCQRLAKRLTAHVTQHQHGAVLRVLDDRREKAAGLVEVETRHVRGIEGCAGTGRLSHGRISMPAARKAFLSSGMVMAHVWNTLAASAASTPACRKTSVKCSIAPAPPEATSGTLQICRTARSCSMS